MSVQPILDNNEEEEELDKEEEEEKILSVGWSVGQCASTHFRPQFAFIRGLSFLSS